MNIYEKITNLINENKSFVLATVIKTEGSTPGKVGFKMIIESDGKCQGTIGGGAIEGEVIIESLRRLSTSESGIVEYLLSGEVLVEKETAKVLEMSCSGRQWIFYEVFGQKPVVYVFGGGHVGEALLRQLSLLNYRKILIDNRPEFANKHKNPFADEIILDDYVKYASTFNPPENSFVVVMTHGHNYDFDIVKIIYERNLKLKYVGVIASKSKAQKLINQLKEKFGAELNLDNFHSPIGLNIGGETPQEIALSIVSEIQAIRYNKTNITHLQ